MLQIQFCAYRNYSSGSDALVASTWETSPEALVDFVQGISPDGGQGNEAIELALYHALEEHRDDDIAQVIVMGDAPPNTSDETREKRRDSGYYQTPEVLCSDVQTELLEAGVTIHAFYVESGHNQRDEFFAIAGGDECKTRQIDLDGEASVDEITGIVTERVLFAYAGDNATGQRLVDAYRQKYPFTHEKKF